MSRNEPSKRVPDVLAELTDEPRERFEHDGEIPTLDELKFETATGDDRTTSHRFDDER